MSTYNRTKICLKVIMGNLKLYSEANGVNTQGFTLKAVPKPVPPQDFKVAKQEANKHTNKVFPPKKGNKPTNNM